MISYFKCQTLPKLPVFLTYMEHADRHCVLTLKHLHCVGEEVQCLLGSELFGPGLP